MRMTLRYFHNPTTGKLVTSIGSLAFALRHKCGVKNAVHHDDELGWDLALTEGVLVLKSRLLASFWGNCITAIWGLFAVLFLWWLPLGLPIRWGWAAFSILVFLPLAVVSIAFWNAVLALFLARRIPDFLEAVMNSEVVTASFMACPTMLLSEQKEKSVKRWPFTIGLLLVILMMTVGRVVIPLVGWAAVIHDVGGGEFSSEQIRWLRPDEYWEYAPRFIRGEALGMLYYEEDMDQVLVLSVRYILENSAHRSPGRVREQIQTWTSNMSYYFAMNIKSRTDVDLGRGDAVNELIEGIESVPVQGALNEALKNAASENLEERFTTLEFEVKYVPIDEYVNKVK